MPKHKSLYAQDHRDQNDKQKNQKQRVANNSVGFAQCWTRCVCVWVKSVQMKNDEVCGDNPNSSYRCAHYSAIGSHRQMVSAGAAPPAAGQKECWPHAHGLES